VSAGFSSVPAHELRNAPPREIIDLTDDEDNNFVLPREIIDLTEDDEMEDPTLHLMDDEDEDFVILLAEDNIVIDLTAK
jgi:hypothetical protein